MRKWFDIRAASTKPEIWIYGDIGESWYEETTSAADFVKEINAIDADEITVRINSVGGSVPDGLAIYNAIRRHPAKVTVAIDGMAMSIASLIAMSGDSVEMAENAVLMIHAPWVVVAGNSVELRERADQLDTWAEAMATCYVSPDGKSKDEVIALLTDGKDHYYTAEEALAEGFIDSVVESIAIAASARVPAEAMARFKPQAASGQQITINGDGLSPELEQWLNEILNAVTTAQETNMTEAERKAKVDAEVQAKSIADAKAKADGDIAAKAAADALAADQGRRAGIEAIFLPYVAAAGMKELQAKLLADTKISPEAAGLEVLAALAKEAEPVAGSFIVRPNVEAEKFRDGVVAAVLARAGKADTETRAVAKASGMMNLSLMEMAKASLSRANVDFSMMRAPEIAQAALTQTTSDFPVLLENAMHKALLGGYNAVPDVWSRFCAQGSVSDFRSHGRYRTGTIGNYQVVNEAGEYENVAIPDGEKQSIIAVDRGLIINLTYQMIMNDDLGAFIGLASDLGRAGKRTIEASVFALLAENSGLGPDMSDGNPLFHARAGANNIGTGAALTMASIDADRVVMASQTDVSGNDFLDLRPAIWLGPVGLGGTARTINDAQYDPDTSGKMQKPNTVRGLFDEVVDTARLTGTRHYMLANPSDVPVIEVAFLNGETEPYIMMEENFNSRGAKYRATLDFGVGAVGYRGAVTNAGQ